MCIFLHLFTLVLANNCVIVYELCFFLAGLFAFRPAMSLCLASCWAHGLPRVLLLPLICFTLRLALYVCVVCFFFQFFFHCIHLFIVYIHKQIKSILSSTFIFFGFFWFLSWMKAWKKMVDLSLIEIVWASQPHDIRTMTQRQLADFNEFGFPFRFVRWNKSERLIRGRCQEEKQ